MYRKFMENPHPRTLLKLGLRPIFFPSLISSSSPRDLQLPELLLLLHREFLEAFFQLHLGANRTRHPDMQSDVTDDIHIYISYIYIYVYILI